ncbi:MAG: hypothetical protein LUF90_08600 [Rikenellaceae bacterium]|nr:hypothetical protein [Rikenellaceae bacterium]
MANDLEDKSMNTNLYEIYPDIDNRVPNGHQHDGTDGIHRTEGTDGTFGKDSQGGCSNNSEDNLIQVSEKEIIQESDLVNPDENTLDRG